MDTYITETHFVCSCVTSYSYCVAIFILKSLYYLFVVPYSPNIIFGFACCIYTHIIVISSWVNVQKLFYIVFHSMYIYTGDRGSCKKEFKCNTPLKLYFSTDCQYNENYIRTLVLNYVCRVFKNIVIIYAILFCSTLLLFSLQKLQR